MLKEYDNIAKDFRCSITKRELFQEVFKIVEVRYGA